MGNRLWLLLTGVLLLAGCAAAADEAGTLTGQVTIGPLTPVVREGEPEPTVSPEVYATRKIVIYEADGETEVARADIDADGQYTVTLPAGDYVVDINRIGIDHARGFPKSVTIEAGSVTRLDVAIDTGMR